MQGDRCLAHIPDGFLSAPVIAGAAVLSAAALAVAVRRSQRRLGEQEAPILGAATAVVFAAQMLTFPLGAGTSAHLLGGVLVATLVGPSVAILVLFSVLLVQALLFQDGGIAALGANTLNVAVIAVVGGYGSYRWLLALVGMGTRRMIASAAAGAYVSVVLVGIAVAIELALSGTLPLVPSLVAIGGIHLLVGLGEAALTAAILAMLMRAQPELLRRESPPPPVRRKWVYAVTAVSMLLAVTAVYAASARPDALEAASRRLGLGESVASYFQSPFADYTAQIGGAWIAAAVGVMVVFAVGFGLVKMIVRTRRNP